MDYTTPPDNTLYQTQVRAAETQSATESQRLSDANADPNVKKAWLQTYLARIIRQNEKAGVTTSTYVVDLRSGQSITNHKVNKEHFAASLNKLPIAQLTLRDLQSGKLSYDQVLTWSAEDVRAGAGIYDQEGAPTQATVKDLLYDMLNRSGNTSVRILVNQGAGGADVVNKRFKQELGLRHTYLQPVDASRFYLGNTTARESLSSIQSLLQGSDRYTKFIKNAMATNIYSEYGVRSQLAGNNYITLANKVGLLDDPSENNRHDVGIIYNSTTKKSYAYAFLNTTPGEPGSPALVQATGSVAEMGRGILRYSGDKLQKPNEAPLSNELTPELRAIY